MVTKSKFLLLGVALLMPSYVFAQALISEIMYDLPKPGEDTGREWIEIQNTSTTSIDFSAWKLFEAGVNHRLAIFKGSTSTPVNSFVVITETPDKFLTDHPGFSGAIFDSSFSLNNTNGETLALKNPHLLIPSINLAE